MSRLSFLAAAAASLVLGSGLAGQIPPQHRPTPAGTKRAYAKARQKPKLRSARGDEKRRLRAEHAERIREQSRIGDTLIVRFVHKLGVKEGLKAAKAERARRDKLGVR